MNEEKVNLEVDKIEDDIRLGRTNTPPQMPTSLKPIKPSEPKKD